MKQVIKKKIIETHNINVEQPILTVLFDMNSVMKMALVDKRVNSHGVEYGMVFQTLILMKKILKMRKWDFVYGFYDGNLSGQLRYNFYHEYKQNRGKKYNFNGIQMIFVEKSLHIQNKKIKKKLLKTKLKKKILRDKEILYFNVWRNYLLDN